MIFASFTCNDGQQTCSETREQQDYLFKTKIIFFSNFKRDFVKIYYSNVLRITFKIHSNDFHLDFFQMKYNEFEIKLFVVLCVHSRVRSITFSVPKSAKSVSAPCRASDEKTTEARKGTCAAKITRPRRLNVVVVVVIVVIIITAGQQRGVAAKGFSWQTNPVSHL